MFRVAGSNEYLAITGWGIKDIKLEKRAWVFPGQKYVIVDVSPANYTFQVQAMSAEKLPFILPAVFTIGPRTEDMESLILYSRLLSPHDKLSNHVKVLVEGIIEGETRVLAASMTMEEIFKGTKEFKKEVFEKVQLELDQFGLKIYNANVKQLVDVPGHEYFSYLGQKIQMEAANKAKIDVSEATMKGAIGAKERDGKTIQNAAKIDADTKIISTQRQGEGRKEEIKVKTDVQIFEYQKEADLAEANAELAKKKAVWSKTAKLAEVETVKAVAMREVELQMEVEKKNALTRTEKLKAESLSKASVDYDIKVQEANWVFYQKQKAAEAILFENQKAAEAQRVKADADLYARKQEAEANFFARKQDADAEFYAKKKEADAISALAHAQGNYLSTLLKPLEGNYAALRDYMMINGRVYQEIASTNAQAVKGLQPKISIWSNGSNGGGEDGNGGGGMKDVAGVYSMLPPLFKSVQEHTGMLPPAWLGKLTDAETSPTTSTITASAN